MCISLGVFTFSVLISIPFMIFTKLHSAISTPGSYDHVIFCIEDFTLIGKETQFGQVDIIYLDGENMIEELNFPCIAR